MHPQIPLPFKLQEDFNFDNFIAEDNQLVINSLQGSSEPFIFLWGESGTGKTHLLQAVCQYQNQHDKTASYLPLNELQTVSANLLDGMENVDLVCLDNIESIYGNQEWEESIFNLFNRIKQLHGRLIISSASSPQQPGAILNDLKSRLNSGLPLNLQALSDKSTIKALQYRAQKLGMELNHDAANYLITRFPRDLSSLWALLNKLDQASLSAQRKLTIPFLKSTLSDTL